MTATEAISQRRATRIPGAWLLPTVAAVLGGDIGDTEEMVGHTALLVLGIGAVAGVLWQLLHPRDLTDRFTFVACCVVVGATFLALVPSGFLLANSGPAHALAGTLAGVVLTERWIRRGSRPPG
ncbi:hypothetical protein AB0N29_07355 [Nocardioides sp. NPDC092400]|uniref:hypothetical protein n=1 Tax=Nocardioides sp. NPDC092400 TaxID=3155196 RepID=UPI0034153631